MDRLFDHHDRTVSHMTQPGLREIYAYWDSLRRGNGVPARTLIDPMAIQPYLGQAGIAERLKTGHVKMRLAGMHWTKLMGVDPRGMPFRGLFDVAERDRAADLIEAVFEGPEVLTMTLSADVPVGPPISGQMAAMPLTDTDGKVTRALIMLDTDRSDVKGPVRFKIRHSFLAPVEGAFTRSGTMGRVPRRPDASFLRVIEGGRV